MNTIPAHIAARVAQVPVPPSVIFHDRGVGRETRAFKDGKIKLHDDADREMLYPELCAEVEAQIAAGQTSGVTSDPCYPDWKLAS